MSTERSLWNISMEAADRLCINRILAAVLHLGNIVFAPVRPQRVGSLNVVYDPPTFGARLSFQINGPEAPHYGRGDHHQVGTEL